MQRTTPSPVRRGLIGPRLWTQEATARHRSRAMNAAAVDAAGIQKLTMSHTRNTEPWARGPWFKSQAPSFKLDRSSGLGYSRINEDSKKRAPKRSPPGPLSPSPARLSAMTQFEKSGRSCESSSGHKGPQGLQPKAPSPKLKFQAPSSKLQA